MPPPMHTKPENVLKRAQELIAVGQSSAALNVLYEHVTSKRSRTSAIASLEPVMLLFVDLCVQLKKGKLAKDGLYQYKNTAQNTSVGTIELVLKKFIELSEVKVSEAQTKAQEVQAAAGTSAPAESDEAKATTATTTNVEDLEAIETPESILLSTVSGEQAKDRTERAIVTPWLKFLWEAYRTVLEILKNNARLEVMYQSTALQAFGFCQTYQRKTEFRRLCELMRNHVANAAKYQSQVHAINLSDPDTLQRHLDTRFQQLNVAVELELWQEAFRSVEDIHTLLHLSKRPAKNTMMANYYEKLTRIFMVSENYLFHAAAWSRYYNLLRQSALLVAAGQGARKDNPATSEAEMTRAASFVLLSALAIPVISTSRSRGALIDVDEARKNKSQRLTNLLGMATAPTRAILFKDAMSKGLLKRARPEIRELYQILEVDFHPLSICRRIAPILARIGAEPEMQRYVAPLQQVILTRLFQQLSQVYESVQLPFVYGLATFPAPYELGAGAIEKFIMNGCKKGDLAIRLDHASGVLTFDSDVFSSARALHPGSGAGGGSAESETGSVQRLQSTPAEIVRSQLTRLAKVLHATCHFVDPSLAAARRAAQQAAQGRAQAGAEAEHAETLARRAIIEKKKELASDALQRRQREDETRKLLQAQQLAARERERLAEEQRAREARRLHEEQRRVKQESLAKEVEELRKHKKNLDLDGLDMDELDSERLRALRIEQMTREKLELHQTLRVTGKRLDHLERAFRRAELPLLPQDYAAQQARDRAAHAALAEETLATGRARHAEAVALKHRLARLVPVYERFRKDLQEKRHDEFEKRRRQADRELTQAVARRKKEAHEQRARLRREREEQERVKREEEARLQREAEEKAAAEAERARALAERKAQAEKDRKEREEAAARQRQREEEAEARMQARRAGGANATAGGAPGRVAERVPIRPLARTDSSERPLATSAAAGGEGGPPRLQLAGAAGKPSWREKQAQKEREAAEGGGAPAPAANTPPPPAADNATADGGAAPTGEAPPPRRAGGYVPPHLRGDGPQRRPEAPPPAERRERDRDGPAAADGPPRPRFARPEERSAREPAARTESPASAAGGGGSASGTGKWVPRHLREKQQQ